MKRILFAIGLVLVAHAAFAQATTIVTQQTIGFDIVDLNNYDGKLSDGITAIVQAIQFDAIGMNGNGAAALTYVLPSKPAHDANGHVLGVPIPALAQATKDKPYTWTLTFIGPNGTATANAPNPFVLATPVKPIAPTNLTIR